MKEEIERDVPLGQSIFQLFVSVQCKGEATHLLIAKTRPYIYRVYATEAKTNALPKSVRHISLKFLLS